MERKVKYIRSENFVERQLGNETVLVPINQVGVDIQAIYSLNDSAASVWHRLEYPQSIAELLSSIKEEYLVGESDIRQDILTLLDELVDGNFVKAIEE